MIMTLRKQLHNNDSTTSTILGYTELELEPQELPYKLLVQAS